MRDGSTQSALLPSAHSGRLHYVLGVTSCARRYIVSSLLVAALGRVSSVIKENEYILWVFGTNKQKAVQIKRERSFLCSCKETLIMIKMKFRAPSLQLRGKTETTNGCCSLASLLTAHCADPWNQFRLSSKEASIIISTAYFKSWKMAACPSEHASSLQREISSGARKTHSYGEDTAVQKTAALHVRHKHSKG